MSLRNDKRVRHRSDERLGALLDEAERRKEQEWKVKGRKTTLFIGIPIIALVLWAAVFLIQYRMENPPVAEVKPTAAATPAVPVEDQKDMEQFDSFRPNSQRVVKRPEPAAPAGQIVDKSDIDFAMRLLNFGQAADKPAAKKP